MRVTGTGTTGLTGSTVTRPLRSRGDEAAGSAATAAARQHRGRRPGGHPRHGERRAALADSFLQTTHPPTPLSGPTSLEEAMKSAPPLGESNEGKQRKHPPRPGYRPHPRPPPLV